MSGGTTLGVMGHPWPDTLLTRMGTTTSLASFLPILMGVVCSAANSWLQPGRSSEVGTSRRFMLASMRDVREKMLRPVIGRSRRHTKTTGKTASLFFRRSLAGRFAGRSQGVDHGLNVLDTVEVSRFSWSPFLVLNPAGASRILPSIAF